MKLLSLALCLLIASTLFAQRIAFTKENIEGNLVNFSFEKSMGDGVIRVVKDSAITTFDLPTFVKIKNLEFKNGTIEIDVRSSILPNAPESARGFIGVAFRITPDNSHFESIYLRPANARVMNQVRRNHSIQYFSFPDYKFDRLRKEFPEEYESYADMELDKWIRLKIIVHDTHAKLFINGQDQPSLIVNDLKLGADVIGGIGLWVEFGTEGFFRNLRITKSE
ncbi:hypothetical protein [Chitinophaga vietnamensis]|uniref:hypothetical protein n=1 Tax=Chitinophaga vietnamensis TaxID=2593957 RepID=UPI001178A354|nr:hypothetical protein [Chitinophaga vietnamensis]